MASRPAIPSQKQNRWIRAYPSMPRVMTQLTKPSTIRQLTKMPVWLPKKVARPLQPSVYASGAKNWTTRMLA